MRTAGLSDDEMSEGLEKEYGITGDAADLLLQVKKKTVFDILKNRQAQKSHTAEGYEVEPGESDGVHIEAEIRTFDDDGNCVSKPCILKFGDREWPRWFRNKGATGFSINEVLHRPSNVEPFEVDAWKGPKPERESIWGK